MGPFIDSDHPEIKKGAVDQSFQDIFLFEILRKVGTTEDFMLAGNEIHNWVTFIFDVFVQLQDFTQYLGHNVRVILIPSVRDAHHDFVFPQVCNSSFRARLVLSNLQLWRGCHFSLSIRHMTFIHLRHFWPKNILYLGILQLISLIAYYDYYYLSLLLMLLSHAWHNCIFAVCSLHLTWIYQKTSRIR